MLNFFFLGTNCDLPEVNNAKSEKLQMPNMKFVNLENANPLIYEKSNITKNNHFTFKIIVTLVASILITMAVIVLYYQKRIYYLKKAIKLVQKS